MNTNIDYLYNFSKEKFLKYTQGNCFYNKHLGYKIINNGIILPNGTNGFVFGGVTDENGVYSNDTNLADTYAEGRQYDIPKELETTNETVIYLGTFHTVWGHCLTDNLKHLWFLNSQQYNELKKKFKDIKLVYVCKTIPSNFKKILDDLNININKLDRITEIKKYKTIIIPNPCFFVNKSQYIKTQDESSIEKLRFYTREYEDIINRVIKKNLNNKNYYEKVYLSRTKIINNRDFGEKDIEKAFKKSGYKIIYPERYSLQEQINIIYKCKKLATTEGSISHNALFMKKGSKLTLIRKADFWTGYQIAINQMKDLDVTYIDSHLSFLNLNNKVWEGPFFMYTNDTLIKYLNINCFNSFTIKKLQNYILFSLNRMETGYNPNIQKIINEELTRAFYQKKFWAKTLTNRIKAKTLWILKRLYKKIK